MTARSWRPVDARTSVTCTGWYVAKIKAVIGKLEDVAEGLRDLYSEQDGRFVLQVQASDGFSLEDVTGLKNGLAHEKEERRKLSERVKAFEGIEPEAAKAALAKVKALGDIDPTKEADRLASEKFEALKGQLVTKHEAELSKVTGESAFLAKKVEALLVDSVAQAAILGDGKKAKGDPTLLLPHVKAKLRVRRDGEAFVVDVLDEKGNPRVADAKGTPMTIEQLVDEMRESDVFGRAFEGTGASGGGAGGGDRRPGGGGGAGPKHIKDFPTPEAKAAWIKEHGFAEFQKLPPPPAKSAA